MSFLLILEKKQVTSVEKETFRIRELHTASSPNWLTHNNKNAGNTIRKQSKSRDSLVIYTKFILWHFVSWLYTQTPKIEKKSKNMWHCWDHKNATTWLIETGSTHWLLACSLRNHKSMRRIAQHKDKGSHHQFPGAIGGVLNWMHALCARLSLAIALVSYCVDVGIPPRDLRHHLHFLIPAITRVLLDEVTKVAVPALVAWDIKTVAVEAARGATIRMQGTSSRWEMPWVDVA